MSPVTVLLLLAAVGVFALIGRMSRRYTREETLFAAWVTGPVVHGTPLPPDPVPRSVAWAVDHNARAEALAESPRRGPQPVDTPTETQEVA